MIQRCRETATNNISANMKQSCVMFMKGIKLCQKCDWFANHNLHLVAACKPAETAEKLCMQPGGSVPRVRGMLRSTWSRADVQQLFKPFKGNSKKQKGNKYIRLSSTSPCKVMALVADMLQNCARVRPATLHGNTQRMHMAGLPSPITHDCSNGWKAGTRPQTPNPKPQTLNPKP